MQKQADSEHSAGTPFIILIPLFNDWDAFAKLAVRLDDVLTASKREADILIVDDASVVDPDPRTTFGQYRACGESRCSVCGGTWAISGRSPSA